MQAISFSINSSQASFFENIYTKIQQIISKVIGIVKTYFLEIQYFFMALIGIKEIIFDGPKKIQIHPSATNVQQVVHQFFQQKQEWIGPLSSAQVHGICYTASGTLGGVASLHTHRLIDLGKAFPVVSGLAGVFFGSGNLSNIFYYVECYQQAEQLAKGDEPHLKEAARRIKLTSVLGIINSLGYLITLASCLFGPIAWLPMVFGGIAMLTGCINIIYDFFFLNKA